MTYKCNTLEITRRTSVPISQCLLTVLNPCVAKCVLKGSRFNNDVKIVELWSPASQLRDTKTDDTIIFKNPITCTPAAAAARGHGTLRHGHIGNPPLGASLAHPPNGSVCGGPQPFLLVNI